MLDTLKVVLPLDHERQIHGGFVGATDAGGELEWSRARRLELDGSHDARLVVLSDPTIPSEMSDAPPVPGKLIVEGSFAKFMQGHNVFGPEDLVPLVAAVAERLADDLLRRYSWLRIDPGDVAAWHAGAFEVYRTDCTASVALRSSREAEEWVRGLHSTSSLRGRPRHDRNLVGYTAYWGQHSRRWTLKVYPKGRELQAAGHKLPVELLCGEHGPALLEHAAPLARLELTLRRTELVRLGLGRGSDWRPETCATLHADHFGRLSMPEHVSLSSAAEDAL
ncbi:phage/plasmid replication protein, II/X family, partial [Rubrivirga sp.]|uniref:phage/plasmid replication protein, II/X family n=1 Tax=Rubrivirga sp. TaxID=1885344 RepID=UPI003C785428